MNRLQQLSRLSLLASITMSLCAIDCTAQNTTLWGNYQKNSANSERKATQSPVESDLVPKQNDPYGSLPSDSREGASVAGVRGVNYTEAMRSDESTPAFQSKAVFDQPKGELFPASKVLAMVAGEPIFAGDLLLTINEIIQVKAADAPEFAKDKMREQGIRELLPRAIERKMFYHQAVSMLPDPSKIEDIKKDLYRQLEEKQLPEMLKKYEAKNSAELDGRLRMLGSSWRAVKEQAAEQEIAKFGITSKIKIKTEISHDELSKEYQRRLEEFHIENRVKWEHLLVSFEKYPDRKVAKRRIAMLGNEIINGAKFDAVAKKDSDGFFAANGGLNDWTKPGSLTNETLEKELFKLPVNLLSDIIETQQGFHIVRVIERQEEGYIPFEETQEKLRESILNQRQEEATNRLLDDVKKKVPYEVFVEGIKF